MMPNVHPVTVSVVAVGDSKFVKYTVPDCVGIAETTGLSLHKLKWADSQQYDL